MTEPRRIYCPLEEYAEAWLELPPVWLGLHAKVRDDVVEKTKELSRTERDFSLAMALLDNFHFPGFEGRPDKWDFSKIDFRFISWVIGEVITDFWKCQQVPKGLSSPLQIGSMEGEATNPAGDLTKAGQK